MQLALPATEVGVAFTHQVYADQLHAVLAVDDPKLERLKLGCPAIISMYPSMFQAADTDQVARTA